jgi:Ca2+-binding RTX toxin-like protein
MAIIFGTNSKDNLHGTSGSDLIFGLGGNDTIFGSKGGDLIDGGAGTDTVNYGASSLGVTVNLATHLGSGGDAQGDVLFNIENLTGSSHGDYLTGDTGNNVISGGGGNDILHGGGGQDHLFGGDGNDTMYSDNGFVAFDGGAGIDTVDFSGRPVGLHADLSTGHVGYAGFFGIGFGDHPYFDLINVENLNGTEFKDYLGGDGGDNVLRGNGGDDVIYAGDGNDVVEGGKGADQMHGGAGMDQLSYQHSSAGVYVNLTFGNANYGDATGDTFDGFENVKGSAHNDMLIGDTGNNAIYGLAGDDQITGGGGGHDALYGGAGNDILFSDGGTADMYGGSGTDTADFSGNKLTGVHADLGTEKVSYAGDLAGPPQLIPQYALVDIENLRGSAFRDSLIGDNGNNVINGAGGNDNLWGAGGNDTFVYERKFGAVDFGKDTIFDFDANHDHLQFDHSVFANFADVQAHMTQIGNNTVITYDANDSVTLLNVHMAALHASDFVFV